MNHESISRNAFPRREMRVCCVRRFSVFMQSCNDRPGSKEAAPPGWTGWALGDGGALRLIKPPRSIPTSRTDKAHGVALCGTIPFMGPETDPRILRLQHPSPSDRWSQPDGGPFQRVRAPSPSPNQTKHSFEGCTIQAGSDSTAKGKPPLTGCLAMPHWAEVSATRLPAVHWPLSPPASGDGRQRHRPGQPSPRRRLMDTGTRPGAHEG